ncbi:hypothetical protein CYMTET_31442 [Cymbomonas tetramitiformis]|uniref:Smr domain-containing protein n=1 Tax=Cymbomonas tetramitiformis TaxID=36881 RepID=A0AAE0KSV2_9CHLO|nr:hypothetical protein CYMTET_31442 [Cymbomonas tetramitiformis]
MCAATYSLQQTGRRLWSPLTTWAARSVPALARSRVIAQAPPFVRPVPLPGGPSPATRAVRLYRDDAAGRGTQSDTKPRSGAHGDRRQEQRSKWRAWTPSSGSAGDHFGDLADRIIKAEHASVAAAMLGGARLDWNQGDRLMALLEALHLRRARAETYEALFRWAKKERMVKVRKHHYNKVISIMGKTGKPDEATWMFNDMQKAKMQANVVTYTILIDAWGKSAKPDEATRVFNDMQEAKVQANAVTFNSLIDAWGKSGKPDEATRVFNDMQKAKVQANAVTFNSLIDAWGKLGKLNEATRVFNDMQKAKVQANTTTYTSLIDAWGKSGKPDEATRVFNDMQKAKEATAGDTITYTSLIDAWGKSAKPDEATRVFNDMQKAKMQANEAKVQANAATFNSLIDAWGKSGKHDEATRMFDIMQKLGVQADTITYNIVIHSLWGLGKYDAAICMSQTVFPTDLRHNRGGGQLAYELDLHGMESGCAQCMVIIWLARLADDPQDFNPRTKLNIITGQGNHSPVRGESSVRESVVDMLHQLASPFTALGYNRGRLSAPMGELQTWLALVSGHEAGFVEGATSILKHHNFGEARAGSVDPTGDSSTREMEP